MHPSTASNATILADKDWKWNELQKSLNPPDFYFSPNEFLDDSSVQALNISDRIWEPAHSSD